MEYEIIATNKKNIKFGTGSKMVTYIDVIYNGILYKDLRVYQNRCGYGKYCRPYLKINKEKI